MMMDRNSYEICFWIKDDNTDTVPVAVLDQVKAAVTKFEGELVAGKLPEKRLLAYPINKQRTAYWAEVAFNLAPDKLTSFKDELKYEDRILRKVILARSERKLQPRILPERTAADERRETPTKPKAAVSPEEAKEIEAQLDTKLKEILEA